jgi:hypothetical protein
MGCQAPLGPVEPKNNAESSHVVHSIFLSIWGRGHASNQPEYGSLRLRAYNEQGNDVARENTLD